MRRIILILMLLVLTVQAKDVYATFTVEAEKSANLAFSSGGIVDEVAVDVTTVVKKGDLLARLQNGDLKAQLDIAQTALKYAKADYDRQVKVKNIIDKTHFDQFAFKYENAKVQLQYQQALLDKTVLKAPFDGVVFSKSVEEGDVVSGAMIRTIFKVQSLYERKLVLEFDQKYWKSIKVGQIFKYSIDGDDEVYKGKISKIYPYADSGNRKIKAEVETKDFVVGLFGDGYITVPEEK